MLPQSKKTFEIRPVALLSYVFPGPRIMPFSCPHKTHDLLTLATSYIIIPVGFYNRKLKFVYGLPAGCYNVNIDSRKAGIYH